uniref:Uncharacterized protein n=1 Tax=Physcomitrium patens TaxID=3218 RepID=A0A2K1IMV4_PHYPA|nr:hypothetical protein PHYPA_026925 [Physcomitrium patens]
MLLVCAIPKGSKGEIGTRVLPFSLSRCAALEFHVPRLKAYFSKQVIRAVLILNLKAKQLCLKVQSGWRMERR